MDDKSEKHEPTRREIKALTPELLGHYHDLLMANDPEGFEKLLGINHVAEEVKEELRSEFKHYAERILRRHWLGQK
jgi:hypothetical protein